MNKNIIKLGSASWLSLGFYRGIKLYNYNYNEALKEESNKMYRVSYAFAYGAYASFLYAVPILWPSIVLKEIYRLEMNANFLVNDLNSDQIREIKNNYSYLKLGCAIITY
jgi:hypothetical protein